MDEIQKRYRPRKRGRGREALSWVLTIAIAIAVAFFFRFFVVEIIRVDGPSMEDTLYTDEQLIVTKLDYVFGKPERGDIIVTKFEGRNGLFVKRIMGLPGETIKIEDGNVYINGEKIDDKYATEKPDSPMAAEEIPKDCVFVMGDNRNNSTDSRVVGPVPMQDIVGVAHFVVYPFDKMKAIGR